MDRRVITREYRSQSDRLSFLSEHCEHDRRTKDIVILRCFILLSCHNAQQGDVATLGTLYGERRETSTVPYVHVFCHDFIWSMKLPTSGQQL